MSAMLESMFSLQSRQSSVSQEIRAGISTFLTMSYVLLLNPNILMKLGIPSTDIVIGTALSSCVGSFVCGIFGNLPFGLAPGVGLSTYLAFGMVLSDGYTLKEAFTSCFISGICLWVFTVTGLSSILMRVIPKSVKLATIVGMGLQIAVVGMVTVQLIVRNEETLIGLGDMKSYKVWFTFFGLLTMGTLLYHQVSGAILISIMATTIMTWQYEHSYPATIIELPNLKSTVYDYIDLQNIDYYKCSTAIMSFLFIGVVDLGGVIFGMSSLAKLTDGDGNVPGSTYAFSGASIGTLVGACMGSTPLIVYVESAAGIKEGGRTGLTAVVIGIFFMISLVFCPLFAQIPTTATASVSILVGTMMISQATEIDWDNMYEAIPAFLTLIIMPLTFSITNGIMFGLIASCVLYITTGRLFDDMKIILSNYRSYKSLSINESDEATAITSVRTPSFLQPNTVVRSPSLILSREDAVAVRKSRGYSVDVTDQDKSPPVNVASMNVYGSNMSHSFTEKNQYLSNP